MPRVWRTVKESFRLWDPEEGLIAGSVLYCGYLVNCRCISVSGQNSVAIKVVGPEIVSIIRLDLLDIILLCPHSALLAVILSNQSATFDHYHLIRPLWS